MKELYASPECELIIFSDGDVIATSGGNAIDISGVGQGGTDASIDLPDFSGAWN